MARILPTIENMLRDGNLPIRDAVWVDVYNRSSNVKIAGTIRSSVGSANMWYVTEISDNQAD